VNEGINKPSISKKKTLLACLTALVASILLGMLWKFVTAKPPVVGRVVEYETNKPIPGAKVIMQYWGAEGQFFISQRGCWKVDVLTTDENGYFTYRDDDDEGSSTFLYKQGYVQVQDIDRNAQKIRTMKVDELTAASIIGSGEQYPRSGLDTQTDVFGRLCANYQRRKSRSWSKSLPDAYELGICDLQATLSREIAKRATTDKDRSRARALLVLFNNCMSETYEP
jgi:hypothetical protein